MTTIAEAPDLESFVAELEQGRSVEAADPMPEEYRRELLKMLRVAGDTELRSVPMIMGYLDVGVPARYVRPLLSIAQDELGHAHIDFQLLSGFGVDIDELVYERPGHRWTAPYVFDAPISTWPEIATVEGLGEFVGGQLVENVMAVCSYAPWRRALRQVVTEERFHVKFGQHLMRELASTPAGRRDLQTAVDWIFPLLLELMGPPPRADDPQLRFRLKAKQVDALRQEYLNYAVPFAESIGLRLPAHREGGRYVLDFAFPCHFDPEHKHARPDTPAEWSDVLSRWKSGGPRSEEHLIWLRSARSTGPGR